MAYGLGQLKDLLIHGSFIALLTLVIGSLGWIDLTGVDLDIDSLTFNASGHKDCPICAQQLMAQATSPEL